MKALVTLILLFASTVVFAEGEPNLKYKKDSGTITSTDAQCNDCYGQEHQNQMTLHDSWEGGSTAAPVKAEGERPGKPAGSKKGDR